MYIDYVNEEYFDIDYIKIFCWKNHWTKLNQTWLWLSLGGPLSKNWFDNPTIHSAVPNIYFWSFVLYLGVTMNSNIKCMTMNSSWPRVPDTTLCDKVFQWLATGRCFFPVSSTNKTDLHNITNILLKVALHTINHQTIWGPSWSWSYGSWIYNYLCNHVYHH